MHRATTASTLVPCLLLLALAAAPALHSQEPADSTQTPSHPFFIKQTWVLGGLGSWDYLTMDVAASRLYIAHSHSVQVVDVTTGALAGEITGLVEAHCIALDDTGEFGYISDGPGSKIIVFDRRTLQTVASIDGIPSPRALVFEPQTRLLFAVRTDPSPAAPAPRIPRTTIHITPRPAPPPPSAPTPLPGPSITIIDPQTRRIVGRILLPETLGFAQADGRGNIFINAPERNRILQFDAQSVAAMLPKPSAETAAPASEPDSPPLNSPSSEPKKPSTPPVTIDWTDRTRPIHAFSLDASCATPKSLAIDAAHTRLFAACNNMKLFVLNADNGQVVATLPIGPETEGVGYDPSRNLIYAANGGAEGSLTIISQSVTDSYAVIQTLPTRQRARTLAVNPDNGQVYLVTDILGMDLSKTGGIGTLETNPVNGTFQVLVVGN
jgi:hypothetical protein